MRVWRLQVTARRSRTQWALLPIVAAVALACTTLLAGLSLLISSTERFALTASLTAAPRSATQLAIESGVPQNGTSSPVLARSDAAAAAVFASVKTTSRTSITSHLVHLSVGAAGTANSSALSYFGAEAEFADHAHLTSGKWPTAPSTTVDSKLGPVRLLPVAVPTRTIDHLGWKLGDRIFVTPIDDYNVGSVIEVVGIYAVNSATDAYWKPDLLGGAGYDPAYPVPGTGGRIVLPAYGPFAVDTGAFASAAPGVLSQPDTVRAFYTPDLSAVAAGDVSPLLDRLAKAQDTTVQATQPAAADGLPVVSTVDVKTALPDLLRRVLASLTITRSSVLVVGLLLLVLGVAALLQTARPGPAIDDTPGWSAP